MKSIILYTLIFSIIYFSNCDDESMNYIIDNIYLGDSEAASNEENLKKYNIDTVVNCAQELTSEYKDLRFIELKLYDVPEQKLLPKFEVAYNFIKKNSKNNILIHCVAGASRSASLVAFYIMRELRWDYESAYLFIKAKRPVIEPNSGFAEQLREYYYNYIRKTPY